jgi:hypothetical protein
MEILIAAVIIRRMSTEWEAGDRSSHAMTILKNKFSRNILKQKKRTGPETQQASRPLIPLMMSNSTLNIRTIKYINVNKRPLDSQAG